MTVAPHTQFRIIARALLGFSPRHSVRDSVPGSRGLQFGKNRSVNGRTELGGVVAARDLMIALYGLRPRLPAIGQLPGMSGPQETGAP